MTECPDCRDCRNLVFKNDRTRISCKNNHYMKRDGNTAKTIIAYYKEQLGGDVEHREVFRLAVTCPDFDDMDID